MLQGAKRFDFESSVSRHAGSFISVVDFKKSVIVAKHKVCLGIFIYVFIYLQFLFQFRARFYEVHLIIGGFCHLEAIIIQVIQTKFFRYFNPHVATLYDFHFLPKSFVFHDAIIHRDAPG